MRVGIDLPESYRAHHAQSELAHLFHIHLISNRPYVITFGQASDMAEYAPMPRVSSIIDDWGPYYVARTKAVMDGTWTSTNTWHGIGDGMVGIGEITSAVPADVKASRVCHEKK